MKIVILLAAISAVAGLGMANSVRADDKRMGDRADRGFGDGKKNSAGPAA